jgi:hypothetical protein
MAAHRRWPALPAAGALLALGIACGSDGGAPLQPAQAGAAGAGGSAAGAGGSAGAGGAGGGSPGGAGASAGGAGASAGGAAGGSGGRCTFSRGWARDVRGGLDGAILRVTTLEPKGPGSLAEALETPGPRVIVFEVGGVIDLGLQTMSINVPYVTIAGQTAPSPGITLIRGTLRIATHDVVLQHVRVRPGQAGQGTGWEPDGISTTSAYDVIIDHCSVTWAVDENLSASGPRFEGATPDEWRQNTSRRITMSRNIVAEALSNATHSKGEHSKGSLIHDNVTDILIYGNLYASNVDRNPLFKGGARGAIVNNYITNPRGKAASYGLVASEWGSHPYENGQMSLVGNVFHHGPDTDSGAPLLRVAGAGSVEVFLDDNEAKNMAGTAVPWIGGTQSLVLEKTAAPTWPEVRKAEPSATMLDALRADVGARPWDRDAIDARIVEQAFGGTGQQIDHETAGGGYPAHAPTSAPFVATDWNECFEYVP